MKNTTTLCLNPNYLLFLLYGLRNSIQQLVEHCSEYVLVHARLCGACALMWGMRTYVGMRAYVGHARLCGACAYVAACALLWGMRALHAKYNNYLIQKQQGQYSVISIELATKVVDSQGIKIMCAHAAVVVVYASTNIHFNKQQLQQQPSSKIHSLMKCATQRHG